MINKRLVKMVPGSMGRVGRSVAVQWLGLVANIVTIFIIGRTLGLVWEGDVAARDLMLCAVVTLVAIALRFGVALVTARLSFLASEQVKLSLRERIYAKLLALGPAYHQQVATSEAVQIAVEGVDQLEIYFGKYLPQLFYSLLAPLTLFVVLAFVNLPAAGVLLACVPLIPISIMAVQKFAKKLLAKYWGGYTRLGDGFLENLQGLTTLKIYGSDEVKNQEMNERAEDFRKITMRVLIMQLNSITLMDLIAYGGAALGIIVAVGQYQAGHVDFAGAFCIILLAAEFFIPLRLLGSFFHIAMNGMAASEKIFNLLDLPVDSAGTMTEVDLHQGITLSSVGFSYDGERTVLADIDLQATTGITAIVGESGSGKSTIAALLTGRNVGYTGSVTIVGAEVSDLAPGTLAETVTLVSHNAYLFKGTVRENLLIAAAGASDEDLWKALTTVKLDEFFRGEAGLDTELNAEAANLSGGQRQRLALARALLHDSPVYVFDEATSNIDVESENAIVAAVHTMARHKTVIMISHRLANVVAADKIYVMDRGQIVADGHHSELLAEGGLYTRLYNTQRELEALAGEEEELCPNNLNVAVAV